MKIKPYQCQTEDVYRYTPDDLDGLIVEDVFLAFCADARRERHLTGCKYVVQLPAEFFREMKDHGWPRLEDLDFVYARIMEHALKGELELEKEEIA